MRGLILLALLPLYTSSQNFSPQEVSRYQQEAKAVTIIRDEWGIPHIYGKTDADAVFGLLYAQCEENFPRVERNYLEMMGRLSEIEGKSQLYQDLEMRLIYDSAAARADYRRSPPWFQKLLDAFADGVNYYLYTHPDVHPLALKKFESWFPLMYTDGSIAPTQNGGLTLQDMRNLYTVNDSATSFWERKILSGEEASGSNGFALAPSRTASKNAMLYINPHVTFYFRSEVQMVSEEGLNAYGAVTWGQFFVYQGFNEHCGWMHTSSYADVADLFAEKIERRGDSIFSRYDQKLLPVTTKTISVSFQQGQKMHRQDFTTFATIHGPVMGSRDGSWLSIRENNRSLDALMQSWLRTKAKGFSEFKKVMELRSNNSNNTVFADDQGHIAYWHANFMPKRSSAFDYSLPVDGSTSATDWKGIHQLDEIVHVYDPASGWIENCNSTPFTVSGKSSPKKEYYPRYMAPDGQNFRALNAVRLLEHANNMTMDELIRNIGYNHYLGAFDSLLPSLIQAYDRLPNADPDKKNLSEPIRLLRYWDRNASSSSVATSLAIEWGYRILQQASPPSNTYKISDAVGQVRSAIENTSEHEKLQLLSETLSDLQQKFGDWHTPWGQINRYQRTADGKFDDNKTSLPVGLGPGSFGSIPSFASRRFENTKCRYGVSGNSFIACVEFGKKLKAKTVITGGQSFDAASNHFTDQADLYINGNFKEVWFYKDDVLRHASLQYHPGERKE
ncbi:MAG: penicillin acylase family protein [Flavisolibacter sp.]